MRQMLASYARLDGDRRRRQSGGMATEKRDHADARLEAALHERGLNDPRDGYRMRLRALRETRPDLFERATRYYQEEVLPALVAGADPIETWIEYGRFLAETISPGRTVTIDDTGSARPYSAPSPTGALVLHLPNDRDAASMPLAEPVEPSPAQRAAYDLLVRRQLALDTRS